jgi:hypothetical protein
MRSLKEIYRKNVYGVMGTLIFHILLAVGFLLAELNINIKIVNEEAILLNLKEVPIEKESILKSEPKDTESPEKKSASNQTNRNEQNSSSNRGVNDAIKKDKFFDDSYKRDIEAAQKMVADVNTQLSKKAPSVKKFEMPEATSDGQNPDSVKNVIYSGKSNIHYSLENRYHLRLPIPVYLAKGGGIITVDIQVDQSGIVTKATARPTNIISDPMLSTYATQAAERTVFNTESKAPLIQKGTITYKFVAQ